MSHDIEDAGLTATVDECRGIKRFGARMWCQFPPPLTVVVNNANKVPGDPEVLVGRADVGM